MNLDGIKDESTMLICSKKVGTKRFNILISSKALVVRKKTRIKTKCVKNICLFCHPSHNKEGIFYVIPIVYVDDIDSFDSKIYFSWFFDKNDKRKIKRIKKKRKPATKPVKAYHR